MPNKIWHKLDPKMIYRHISFHGNGGTGTMADFDATVDSILPTNQFTHDSLIFYGWSTNTDATGNFYEDKAHLSEITQETTLHLYAIWGSSGLYFITDTTTCYVMESPSGFNATNLIIPPYNKTGKKVTSIQTDGFDENTNIQKVKIPYSIHTIGDNAFENCTNLKEVELANGVKTIREEVFQGCENLESITIPDSVTLIGKNTFKNCNKLTNINITPNTYWTYNNEKNSILGCPIEMIKENIKNKVQYYWHQVDKNQELYTITLNENDDEIKTHPRNSSYLFQMTPLNAKLPKIMFTQAPPEWDFCGWSTTKDGSGNYFKDEGMYETDSQEKNVSLYAIWGIKGLQYSSGDTTCDIVGFTPSTTTQFLVIPYYNQYGQKVTGIGENVFKGWAQNTSTILKMPSSITTLGKAAFMNTNITKVSSWSDEITEIPESLFEGSSLLTVRIPDEVTTIGNRAFYNSLNLSGTMLDFVIPKNVTSIGESAFNSTIPSVKIEATTPPSLGSNNFQNVEKIYVPTGSLSLYQAADGWKDLPLYEK